MFVGIAAWFIGPTSAVLPQLAPTTSYCVVDFSDGIVAREYDGSLTSYVMDSDGQIWKQGEALPCKYLKRYGNV
jgi:hypothetical protein